MLRSATDFVQHPRRNSRPGSAQRLRVRRPFRAGSPGVPIGGGVARAAGSSSPVDRPVFRCVGALRAAGPPPWIATVPPGGDARPAGAPASRWIAQRSNWRKSGSAGPRSVPPEGGRRRVERPAFRRAKTAGGWIAERSDAARRSARPAPLPGGSPRFRLAATSRASPAPRPRGIAQRSNWRKLGSAGSRSVPPEGGCPRMERPAFRSAETAGGWNGERSRASGGPARARERPSAGAPGPSARSVGSSALDPQPSTRSTTVAIPCPTPMHIVARP
jgi:hypothetical protein